MNSQQQQNKNEHAGSGTPGLRISGRVEVPLELDLAGLLAMETVEAEDLLLICGSGEPRGKIARCKGVLLADIINKASVIITDHNDTKKMYIIASSADGYKAVFSWQEIFNSPVGEGVMVVLEKDEKILYEEFGALDLLSAKDTLTGPRYVRQLGTLEIVMVN